jgi:hypothetical protein
VAAALALFVGVVGWLPEMLTDATPANPPARQPIIPPAVPPGAPENFAEWSYMTKVDQVWGRDWSTAVRWLEEFNARYPWNGAGIDKLYVALIELGHELNLAGDIAGARVTYERADQLDPSRGTARDAIEMLR